MDTRLFLPEGAQLHGRFTISRVLNVTDGVVDYLVTDGEQGGTCVCREYLPQQSAMRAADQRTLYPKTPSESGRFESGMRQFMRETDRYGDAHPGMILSRFRENGTAYSIMPYTDPNPSAGAAAPQTGSILQNTVPQSENILQNTAPQNTAPQPGNTLQNAAPQNSAPQPGYPQPPFAQSMEQPPYQTGAPVQLRHTDNFAPAKKKSPLPIILIIVAAAALLITAGILLVRSLFSTISSGGFGSTVVTQVNDKVSFKSGDAGVAFTYIDENDHTETDVSEEAQLGSSYKTAIVTCGNTEIDVIRMGVQSKTAEEILSSIEASLTGSGFEIVDESAKEAVIGGRAYLYTILQKDSSYYVPYVTEIDGECVVLLDAISGGSQSEEAQQIFKDIAASVELLND